MNEKIKLKAYFWKEDRDSDMGIAVIAENSKEAKEIGYNYWGSEHGHECEWIDQRVNLIKNAKIDGLSKGGVDNWLDGLKRGLYGFVEDICPICNDCSTICYDEEQDKIGCDGCLYPVEE